MEYVLLKYAKEPDRVVQLAATADPAEAVALARQWKDRSPREGLIVTVEREAIVHCEPCER